MVGLFNNIGRIRAKSFSLFTGGKINHVGKISSQEFVESTGDISWCITMDLK
jgi:hypothetical protein